tara:strand:+ start:5479 stop:6417 length:939 start_codon:yes stop_codon:yes gene_type:complete
MRLFTIGSSNTDLVIYLDHIPKIGETVIGGESQVIFGGKGANQAVAAKKAGSDVKFITQLGDDSFGNELIKYFKSLDLPEKYLLIDKNQPSGIAQIFVSKKGENSIAVASGSNGTLFYERIESFLEEIINDDLLLMQFEIPLETVISVINYCHNKKVKTIINPAPAAFLPDSVIKKIWMITPNESEAELLTGISVIDKKSTLEAAEKLINKGIEHCIITLGKKGSIWLSPQGGYEFKVPAVNAVDSTAAGDVFNGYLANAISGNLPIEKAIAQAHAAASLSVTIKGAQTSIPSKEEAIGFLKLNPITSKKIY